MSLLEALLPLIKTLQVIGLGPFTVDSHLRLAKHASLVLYSALSLVLFTALLIYGFFDQDSYYLMTEAHNDIAHTVDFIQLVGIRVAHIVILIEALLHRDDFIRLLQHLDEWDASFLLPNPKTADISHPLVRRRLVVKLAGAASFYGGIQLVLLAIVLMRQEYAFVYYWASYLVPFLVCCFRYFQIYVITWLLQQRFELINCKLDASSLSRGIPTTPLMKDTKSGLKYQELARMRSLYDKLWEIARLANNCFGLSLLVNIGNDFVAITGHCYWIFLTIKDLPVNTNDILAVAGSMIWTVPAFLNVIVICAMCHKASSTANDTGLVVHKITYDAFDHSQILFIEQFSLQLLHQKVSFTAFGFFNVDFTLLFTMAGATTTYLVILIQFHFTEE